MAGSLFSARFICPKKKCSSTVPLTTCKDSLTPRHANPHTMDAERFSFLSEPFLPLPQTPGVTQTTCCCSHSNPKRMTSSRHTTYLIKCSVRQKRCTELPCMIATQSAHLMHTSLGGHSSYEVLILPCSKASRHKPRTCTFGVHAHGHGTDMC